MVNTAFLAIQLLEACARSAIHSSPSLDRPSSAASGAQVLCASRYPTRRYAQGSLQRNHMCQRNIYKDSSSTHRRGRNVATACVPSNSPK